MICRWFTCDLQMEMLSSALAYTHFLFSHIKLNFSIINTCNRFVHNLNYCVWSIRGERYFLTQSGNGILFVVTHCLSLLFVQSSGISVILCPLSWSQINMASWKTKGYFKRVHAYVIFQAKYTVDIYIYSQTCLNEHFRYHRDYSLHILPLLNDHLLNATNGHEIISLTVNCPSCNGHLNA